MEYRWLVRVSLLGLLCGMASGSRAQAQDARRDQERASQVWKERRERTRALKYSLVGKCMTPKGILTGEDGVVGEVPSKDYWFERRTSGVLDFATSQFRREFVGEDYYVGKGSFVREHLINTFDGRTFKAALPKEGEGLHVPDVILGSTDLSKYAGPFFPFDELPIFFACGISNKKPDPRQLQETEELSQFQAEGYTMHKGRRCLLLRSGPEGRPRRRGVREEFLIDVERGSVPVKWMAYGEGRLEHVTEIEWARRDVGWVPEKWEDSRYEYRAPRPAANERGRTPAGERKAQLYSFVSWRVEEWVLNPSLEPGMFDVERKPGMIVQDEEKGNRAYFIVEESGSLTPVKFAKDGTPQRIVFWSWWRIGICVISVLFFAFVLHSAIRRLRRKALDRPTSA